MLDLVLTRTLRAYRRDLEKFACSEISVLDLVLFHAGGMRQGGMASPALSHSKHKV